MRAWYAKHRGTARDLPDLYRTLIAAIRSVDVDTPLMLDAGWYAAADAFAYWPAPLDASALLSGFHLYELYAATSAPNHTGWQPSAYLVPVSWLGQATVRGQVVQSVSNHV